MRMSFHHQLSRQLEGRMRPEETLFNCRSGGYRFRTPVREGLGLAVELDLLLLVPSGLGRKPSDLDNRTKTIIDALRVPSSPGELKHHTAPAEDGPMVCLLEDDLYVEQVRSEVRRWFEPEPHSTETLLIVTARIVSRATLSSPTATLALLL